MKSGVIIVYNDLKINERITEARKAKSVSQKELSQKTGLSSSTISAYEQGTRNPTKENYRILADFLEVPVLWLMGLDEGIEYTDEQQEVLNMLQRKKQIDIAELKSKDIELIIDGRKATEEEIAVMTNLIISMREYHNKN